MTQLQSKKFWNIKSISKNLTKTGTDLWSGTHTDHFAKYTTNP